jgi:hypothetical protein
MEVMKFMHVGCPLACFMALPALAASYEGLASLAFPAIKE